ncbi:MAG TPA: type II toxin-antitoxin system RelE/ParE family toxin [Nitrospiria bacterium]|nr:type II toxin-antitoxin system RelE/ParE family toxin [Nitrospiria bacterium]
MPATRVVFYQEQRRCPVLEWLDDLPKKIQAKAQVRIERLAELGHELHRPDADYLRDGMYELRWRFQSVNYRILYFYHGTAVVVLAHGLTKEDQVPVRDIELARTRKVAFESDPDGHTYREE